MSLLFALWTMCTQTKIYHFGWEAKQRAQCVWFFRFQVTITRTSSFLTRRTNELFGRELTDEDAHAIYELLNPHRLSRKRDSTARWAQDLQLMAFTDYRLADAFCPLINRMDKHCEKFELPEEKRAQLQPPGPTRLSRSRLPRRWTRWRVDPGRPFGAPPKYEESMGGHINIV
ncbi:hypothetical protein M3Y99_01401100 [Aphelenchoides fujianensis]|nr:hypothetical protein M3Y99_01401100 [Aphelenchoides fujianensis]